MRKISNKYLLFIALTCLFIFFAFFVNPVKTLAGSDPAPHYDNAKGCITAASDCWKTNRDYNDCINDNDGATYGTNGWDIACNSTNGYDTDNNSYWSDGKKSFESQENIACRDALESTWVAYITSHHVTDSGWPLVDRNTIKADKDWRNDMVHLAHFEWSSDNLSHIDAEPPFRYAPCLYQQWITGEENKDNQDSQDNTTFWVPQSEGQAYFYFCHTALYPHNIEHPDTSTPLYKACKQRKPYSVITVAALQSKDALEKAYQDAFNFNTGDIGSISAGQIPGGFQGNNIDKYVQNVWTIGTILFGSLAILKIVLGGIMYATAAGNAQRTSDAKSHIFYALIGLGLIIIANVVLQLLGFGQLNIH